MPAPNETALEKTFSDLAYSHLRDKSQALLDYLVGFQLLKQENDGQRAVGIFGFEIDEDYYYAPIFFLNGEIRGLDCLYSVKSDIFMPLTDDWVNTVINRRQLSLGEKDTRSRAERGTRVPNYSRLKIIPGGGGGTSLKLGSAQLQKLSSAMMGENADLAAVRKIDLTHEIAAVGAGPFFKAAMDRNPRFRAAFEDFGYNYLDLAGAPVQQEKVAAEDAVVLINSVTDEGVDELTDEQRTTVLEGGTAVIDNRPEVAKAILYRKEVERELENPTTGALYDVLWSDGAVAPALVCPIANGENEVFVFRPNDGDKYCSIDRRKVFVTRMYSANELNDWLKKNTKEASAIKPQEVVVFIGCEGDATAAFCISDVRTGIDGITVATVNDRHHMDAGNNCSSAPCISSGYARGNNGDPEPNQYNNLPIDGMCDRGTRQRDPTVFTKEVIITEAGGRSPRFSKTQVIVNDKHFYALKVNTFKLVSTSELYEGEVEKYGEPRKDAQLKESDFGCYSTVYEALDKVAAELKTWKTGRDLTVKTAGLLETVASERDALAVLMQKLGMSETDARVVIAEAGPTVQYYKLSPTTKAAAAMLDLPEIRDTDLGGFMNSYHQSQVPYATTNKRAPEDNREFYRYYSPFAGGAPDSEGGNDGGEDTFGIVDEAAKTGEKEVFDAAALGSLIKAHNPTDLVDRFLPTITSGMDRIGRMLFLIYWHYEDFEERYGEDELSEFMDNLRTVFEQLGDIVIFAKKRTLAGDPEHYGLGAAPNMEG
jgi:hypothetical protein